MIEENQEKGNCFTIHSAHAGNYSFVENLIETNHKRDLLSQNCFVKTIRKYEAFNTYTLKPIDSSKPETSVVFQNKQCIREVFKKRVR